MLGWDEHRHTSARWDDTGITEGLYDVTILPCRLLPSCAFSKMQKAKAHTTQPKITCFALLEPFIYHWNSPMFYESHQRMFCTVWIRENMSHAACHTATACFHVQAWLAALQSCQRHVQGVAAFCMLIMSACCLPSFSQKCVSLSLLLFPSHAKMHAKREEREERSCWYKKADIPSPKLRESRET